MHEPERIRELVSGWADLLSLVKDGQKRLETKPDDLFVALSTFVLVYSLWDWAAEDEQPAPRSGCPYYEAIREIANGTKHLALRPSSYPDQHVEGFSPTGGWDEIEWDELHWDQPVLTVNARRHAHEDARWRSAMAILAEAIGWWDAHQRSRQ